MSELFSRIPTLTDTAVRLEPLSLEHVPALIEAASDGRLWQLWYTSVPSPEKMHDYVALALDEHHAGTSLPFVVKDGAGTIIGSTRYCHIDGKNRRVEIGYTWYAQRAQRTALNTQAKKLLLGYAFETMQCIAVEFRTHWFNHASRAAIARLGAKQDGILRNHQRMADGSLRDTVVFSIIDNEWLAVKKHLSHLSGAR